MRMMNLLESGQRNAGRKWEGRKKPAGAKNSAHGRKNTTKEHALALEFRLMMNE